MNNFQNQLNKQNIMMNFQPIYFVITYQLDLYTFLLYYQGVNSYVSELDFPRKEYDPTIEDDENAHVNSEGTKLLTYIYAD